MNYGSPAIASNSSQIGRTDWNDPESVALCSRLIWESRGYKSDLEERAWRNYMFLWGKQWYWWDDLANDGMGAMVPRKDVPGWQTRLVYNEVLSTVNQRIAKLIRANRVWTPLPATSDESDRVVQRLQAQVMEYQWTDGVRMPEKLQEALQWAMSSAVVFARPFWNRRKGPRIEVPMDGFVQQHVAGELKSQFGQMPPNMAQNVMQVPENQAMASSIAEDADRRAKNDFWQTFGPSAVERGRAIFNAGDVDVDICPLYEVAWWPFFTNSFDRGKVKIWHWTTKVTAEEAAEDLGITPDEVREMAQPSAMSVHQSAGHVSEWGNKHFWPGGDAETGNDDSVLRHILYKEPCDAYPNGRMAVHLGYHKEAVFLDDLQTVRKLAPMIPLVELPIRGSAAGTCIVDQLVPAQENYNRAASQVSDYCRKKISPTVIEYTGNTPQQKGLSNAPGRIYKANNKSLAPNVLEMPDIGFDYFNTMNIDRSWMRDLGGIAAIDVGKTDGADVKSGRAILALKEQNDLRLVPFGERIDRFVEEIGIFLLREIQEKVSDKRIIQIIGEDNELEVVAYRGQDLMPSNHGEPGANDRPLRVRAHSVIPRSPQEMLSIFNVAMEAGYLGPQDRNSFFDAMGLQDFRQQFDKTRKDKTKQADEIAKWERGEVVGAPEDADNDTVHLEVIEPWMTGEKFRRIKMQAKAEQMQAQMMGAAMGLLPPKGQWTQVYEDIVQHRDGHKAQLVRDVVDQQYQAMDAHLDMWMKHRAKWMNVLQQQAMSSPDGMPDQSLSLAVAMAYQLPLVFAGGGGGEHKPQGGEKKNESGDKKKASPMPNGESPNQGVRNNEKTVAA